MFQDMAKRIKFYKVDDGNVYRHGFIYSFCRVLDPLEPGADPQWHQSYHCSRSENDQQKCQAEIYTTGKWKVDKKKREYQYGIFKTEGHSHEPGSDENAEEVEPTDNHKIIHNDSTMDCASVQECEVDAQENEAIEHRDSNYENNEVEAETTDMAKRIKFYKVDDGNVYRHGFIYSFCRVLDPLEPGADPQWHQSYHCSRSENDQQKCQAEIYTTGKWKVDKKKREYQYGIFKTEGHSHEPGSDENAEEVEPIDNHEIIHNDSTMDCASVQECEVDAQENEAIEHRDSNYENNEVEAETTDTTEWHKFYKNDDTSLCRSAYVYTFYGDLDPFEQGISPELCLLYHCSRWENRQQKCQAEIYTTGDWKVDKNGREFQYGIFKTEGHSHEPGSNDNTEDVEPIDNHEPNESTMDFSTIQECNVDAQKTDNENHSTGRHFSGNTKDSSLTDVYEFNDTDESDMDQVSTQNSAAHQETQQELGETKNKKPIKHLLQEKCNVVDEKDSGKVLQFYKYKDSSVYHAGFVYNFSKELKSQRQWKWRMRCFRQIKRKKNCHACIWTTGVWQVDKEGREYQCGIIVQTHDHEPYQHVLEEQKEYNNDTKEVIRFPRYSDKSVHYKGFVYTLNSELKSVAYWKWRMRCQWKRRIGGRTVACNGLIWTTGKWEIKEGSEYQSGIIMSEHSHDPYQYLLKGSKFYPYEGTSVQRNGFVYSLKAEMNRPPWTQRMACGRRINGKQSCHGTIWTTGDWKVDQSGAYYQRGVVISGHSHEPYQIDGNSTENVTVDDLNGTQYNHDNTGIPSGSEQLSPPNTSICRYALRNQTSEETSFSKHNTLSVSPTNNGKGPNYSNTDTESEQTDILNGLEEVTKQNTQPGRPTSQTPTSKGTPKSRRGVKCALSPTDILNGPEEVTKQNTQPGRPTSQTPTSKGTPKSRRGVKCALSPTGVPNDSEQPTQQNTPKRRFTLRSQAQNRSRKLSSPSTSNEKVSCFQRPNIKHQPVGIEISNVVQQLVQQSSPTRRAILRSRTETPKSSKSADITVPPTNNGEEPIVCNMEVDIEPNDIQNGSEQQTQQNTPKRRFTLRSQARHVTPQVNRSRKLSSPSTINEKESCFKRLNNKHQSPTKISNGVQQLAQQSSPTRRAILRSRTETPKSSKSADIAVPPTNNGEEPIVCNMEVDIEPNDIPSGSEQLTQQNTPKHGATLRSETSKETPRAKKNTRLSLPSTINGKEPNKRSHTRRLSLPSIREKHNTEGICRNSRTSVRPQHSSGEERNVKCSIS
ncbi:hypothetical protein Ddc_00041 [Ditylenchus destructor]|nr:hypothetical protein Ddc_00041 [Ditylenchus destructor]